MAVGLLDAWIGFSKANIGLQQFGQGDDESTYNGATGCTHTVLQRLVKAKTGVHYSHDEISKIATYPWPAQNPDKRGMYSGGSDNEVGRVMAHFGLPYRLITPATYADWRFLLPGAGQERGPALIGVRYGWWPEDKGYVYRGITADGRPNGFCGRNGKTQLIGFEGGYHAVLLIGARKNPDSKTGYYCYANEPNHGSPARPEKPDYDRTSTTKVRRAFEQYGSTGRRLFAWVPTATFRPKGY